MRRLCILFFMLLLLWGCAAEPAAAPLAEAAAPTLAPVPSPAPTPRPAPDAGTELLYLLAASEWQDIYDENYTLAFDAIGNTMTEKNKALNSETVYRISVEAGALCLWAEGNGGRQGLPYTYEDGILTVDYGDPVGAVTYAAAVKMP